MTDRILTISEINHHPGWWGTFDPPVTEDRIAGRGWASGTDLFCPISAACAAIKWELMRLKPPEHDRKKKPSEAQRKRTKDPIAQGTP